MAPDSDDPFERVEEFRREISRMIREFYVDGNPMCLFSKGEWRPPTDVYETGTEIVVKMEVAGMQRDDFTVLLEGSRLIIFGQRKSEPLPENANFRQMEIKYTRFHREFLMPGKLAEEDVAANYQEGFLTVRVAKKASKPGKQKSGNIEIRG